MKVNKTVPIGWDKGESITVEKTIRGNNVFLMVTQVMDITMERMIKPDHVYCILFKTHNDFSEWLKWWMP